VEALAWPNMQNNIPYHAMQMGQYAGAQVAQPHPDLMSAFDDRWRPPQAPYNGAMHQGHFSLGMAAPGGAQQRSNLQPAYAHLPRLPLDLEQHAPAKRQRPNGGGPVPDDALMDLARENLVLKQQLHIAIMEVRPDHTPIFIPALHRTFASRAQGRSFTLHSVASAGC